MSSFDDLLGQYEQPSEVDIALPGRVGAAGDKGGTSNTAANAPVSSPAESQAASTAPEPAPQLPEGSDAEERAAAEEEEAAAKAEAVQAAQKAEATAEAEASAAEDAADSDDDVTDIDPHAAEPEAVEPETGPVQQGAPYPVIPRKGGSLTFDGPSVNLKYFPRALIDQMREILKPRLGEDFSRDLSQFSLVTAFVIAAMGAEITTDEYTAEAVKAFRANDPKTDAIEKRTVALLEQQAKSESMLKKISEKLGEVADTAAVLEMGQAYALAERTAHLDTDGVVPETIDVTQKRAVASRDNIRKRVKIQQREEKVRAGRPIR